MKAQKVVAPAAAPVVVAAPVEAAAVVEAVVEAPAFEASRREAPGSRSVADAASEAVDMDHATVTRRVTVRTIVDGVEHVEVREETVESVDASTVADYNPSSIDTTVIRRETTVVDGEVVESSESLSTES